MGEEFTVFKRVWWLSHIIFQQCTAIVVFNILWTVYEVYDLSTLSAWHVVFCTLGYAFFMAEAVVLFASNSVLTLNVNRVLRGTIHGVLMGCGTLSLTVGMAIKMKQKNDANRDHFTSIHGILGFVSLICTLTAVCGGILVKYSINFKDIVRPVFVKFLHNFLGISAYGLGMLSLGYGVKKFAPNSASDETVVVTNVLLGIITCYSLIGAFISAYLQLRQIVNR